MPKGLATDVPDGNETKYLLISSFYEMDGSVALEFPGVFPGPYWGYHHIKGKRHNAGTVQDWLPYRQEIK
jgi:hypothetical protein